MKSFAILAAAVAGAAYAQDMPQPEGQCAQMCANNMAMVARQNFSCDDNDLGCFCNESNWAYGIRDCSNEACEPQEALSAQAWAAARCAGVAETATGTPNGLPILTSAVASASDAMGTMSASNTDNVESVTATITTVISSSTGAGVATSGLVSSASSVLASAASSLQSELASITRSVASELSSALPDGTDSTNALQSATSAAGDAASTVTSAVGGAASTVTDESGNAVSTVTDAAGDAAATASDAASGDEEGAAPKVTAVPFVAGLAAAAWFLI
jgi:hypothetical protein